jgi:hypothetical protein
MSPKTWNPRARKCSECRELRPLRDKEHHVDPMKKECAKFGWLIMNDAASKQAVCRIENRR